MKEFLPPKSVVLNPIEKFNPVVKNRQRPWRVAKQVEFLLQGNKSKFHYGVKISRFSLAPLEAERERRKI